MPVASRDLLGLRDPHGGRPLRHRPDGHGARGRLGGPRADALRARGATAGADRGRARSSHAAGRLPPDRRAPLRRPGPPARGRASASIDAAATWWLVAQRLFHEKHRRLYGFERHDTPVELVRLQVSVIGRTPALRDAEQRLARVPEVTTARRATGIAARYTAAGAARGVDHDRDELGAGRPRCTGPCGGRGGGIHHLRPARAWTLTVLEDAHSCGSPPRSRMERGDGTADHRRRRSDHAGGDPEPARGGRPGDEPDARSAPPTRRSSTRSRTSAASCCGPTPRWSRRPRASRSSSARMHQTLPPGARALRARRHAAGRPLHLQRSPQRQRHAQERREHPAPAVLGGRAGLLRRDEGPLDRHRRQGPRQLVARRHQHVPGGDLHPAAAAAARERDVRRGARADPRQHPAARGQPRRPDGAGLGCRTRPTCASRSCSARFGREEVERYIDSLLDYSEARIRAAIREVPDGVYRGEDMVDSDGVSYEPVRVVVEVKVEGDEITLRLLGVRGPALGARAGTPTMPARTGAARVAMKCLFGPDIDPNEGFYRPLTIVTRPGVSPTPSTPAPGTPWDNIGRAIMEAIFFALAPALPDRVSAGIFGGVQAMAIAGRGSVHRRAVHPLHAVRRRLGGARDDGRHERALPAAQRRQLQRPLRGDRGEVPAHRWSSTA